jgi:cell division protease FtsH
MQTPIEDRYLMQRRDLMNQLALLLGGRSAEEIALGEISTGAQNDLQRVTDMARSMVTEWGMSERLGAVNFDARRGRNFLDTQQGGERGLHSEETARIIDDEVKIIVTEAHNEARRILLEKRDILEIVTRRLLDKEVMEGDELREILAGTYISDDSASASAAPATQSTT